MLVHDFGGNQLLVTSFWWPCTQVVELLCHEMARAFAETGTPLPPWRQVAAMLSKW
jgi:hypothetical protein